MKKYHNRVEAGKVLATALQAYAKQSDTLVLALPRGGVPVAYQIAQALSLPLDLMIVRKLGTPGHSELAMGAIASGGSVIFNDEILRSTHIQQVDMDAVIAAEKAELARREQLYRGHLPPPDFANKTIILVDDGMATGATMRAAITALRSHKPKAIVIAVPVAARDTCLQMASLVEKIVCPLQPIDFYAVGLWYEEFPQTSDEEVCALLAQANH